MEKIALKKEAFSALQQKTRRNCTAGSCQPVSTYSTITT